MTDYEQALTVAIKALSELIEDNRNLRATIETLRGSKPSTSSNQKGNTRPLYGIRLDALAKVLDCIIKNDMGAYVSIEKLARMSQYVSDHANEFIVIS